MGSRTRRPQARCWRVRFSFSRKMFADFASCTEFFAASEKQLSPSLEKIIEDISHVGVTWYDLTILSHPDARFLTLSYFSYQWEHLKQLLALKMSVVRALFLCCFF